MKIPQQKTDRNKDESKASSLRTKFMNPSIVQREHYFSSTATHPLIDIANQSHAVKQLRTVQRMADGHSAQATARFFSTMQGGDTLQRIAFDLNRKDPGHPSSQPVTQLFFNPNTKEHITIPWDKLEEFDLLKIYNLTQSGEWKFENDEEAKFIKVMKMNSLDFESDIYDDEDADFDGNQLNPDQQELYEGMKIGLEQKVKERKGKKMPGRSVQGSMLEEVTSNHIQNLDMGEINANKYAMNIAGIDHLQDHPKFSFIQDKLHLSKETAHTETYRAHYKNRFEMAKKLLVDIDKKGKKSEQIMLMFEDAISQDAWMHKDIYQLLVNKVKEHWAEYEEALNSKSSTSLPSLVEDEQLIEDIGNHIAFSVPKDIWELLYNQYENGFITEDEMQAYIRLDLDTSEFIQVFEMLSDYTSPYNEHKVKDEDEDWN